MPWALSRYSSQSDCSLTPYFFSSRRMPATSGGEGVWELRIDWGPGYRVLYARASERMILLLLGGDKRKQEADTREAKEYWRDYQKRTEPKGRRPG